MEKVIPKSETKRLNIYLVRFLRKSLSLHLKMFQL